MASKRKKELTGVILKHKYKLWGDDKTFQKLDFQAHQVVVPIRVWKSGTVIGARSMCGTASGGIAWAAGVILNVADYIIKPKDDSMDLKRFSTKDICDILEEINLIINLKEHSFAIKDRTILFQEFESELSTLFPNQPIRVDLVDFVDGVRDIPIPVVPDADDKDHTRIYNKYISIRELKECVEFFAKTGNNKALDGIISLLAKKIFT